MRGAELTVGVTHLVKPPFTPELKALGERARIIYFDSSDEAQFDPAELKKLDVFLVWTPAITERAVSELTRCKILVRYGVGYDKIDIAALCQAGIAFSNNPEYGPEDVADTAMAMLLGLQRRVFEHDLRCRSYQTGWQENHLPPVHHSRNTTVGVVGVGRIGISLINRLKPFGYRIVGYDPYISNGHARALGIERVDSLEMLFAQCDMISLHCPLTEETKGVICESRVSAARPGLILVNTARGGLVDSLDTIESGLRSGQLGAVGLDVLPLEPPVPHPLIDAWKNNEDWLVGRLIINPHNAFYSNDSMQECRYEAARTAQLYIEQGIHRNAITGEAG